MRKETIDRIKNQVLSTWQELNSFLLSAGEDDCRTVMEAEMAGKRRLMFVLRIHSRMNKLRAARERVELKRRLA
jgi:hypothetical protein